MEAATQEVAARVLWAAQPGPQEALISCPVEDVFFGGARGGGKTDGALGDWIAHQDEHGRQARGVIFRRTMPELEEVQARARELFLPLGAVYKVQARTWVFPNGAPLKMRFLERDADADRYQGHQYTWMCFEEAGNWPSAAPIDKLRACLRSAHGVPCYLRLTGNPGGVGHNWLKARYVDPAPLMTPFYSEEAKCWRVFIPSRLEDNRALVDNDPDYWKRVAASAAGNDALLKAWRDGDWDIVAGGMFDDVFRRDRIVRAPFRIPKSWRVDRSFDWGSSRPFSIGWWAESDGTTAPDGRHYPAGSIIRLAEWYGWNGRPNEGCKMLATDVARGCLAREREMREGGLIVGPVEPGPADAAIYAAENGVCISDDMARAGVSWTKADKSPGSRAIGWERMRRLMIAAKEDRPEEPGLWVFDTCTHFIRTVPVLPRDPKKPEDVDTKSEDHVGDEARYRAMQVRPPTLEWTVL